MAISNDDVVHTLNDLIETCEDGIHGFRTAAESVKNARAKELFLSRLPNIERGAAELRGLVRQYGGDPDRRGTVGGALHRGWIDLKGAVTRKDEEAIVKECERGEEHAAKVYEDALQKALPANVSQVVEKQYRGVLQNLERVRALRMTAEAAEHEPERVSRRDIADREPPPTI